MFPKTGINCIGSNWKLGSNFWANQHVRHCVLKGSKCHTLSVLFFRRREVPGWDRARTKYSCTNSPHVNNPSLRFADFFAIFCIPYSLLYYNLMVFLSFSSRNKLQTIFVNRFFLYYYFSLSKVNFFVYYFPSFSSIFLLIAQFFFFPSK